MLTILSYNVMVITVKKEGMKQIKQFKKVLTILSYNDIIRTVKKREIIKMIINELKKQANREMYWVLDNITEYSSFEEYTKYTNNTREDFKSLLEDGYIQDITPINWNLNAVINTLLEEVNSEAYDYVSDSDKNINRIWDFVSTFDTFILEGKMYFNAD